MVRQSPKGKILSGWGAGYGWRFCALIYRKLWEDELAGTKFFTVVGYCGGSWLLVQRCLHAGLVLCENFVQHWYEGTMMLIGRQ
jgi:hypothetical protein